MADGVAILGTSTPAGRRLNESRVFFEFLEAEVPTLLKRWREYREECRVSLG